jgi:hypothetical protein
MGVIYGGSKDFEAYYVKGMFGGGSLLTTLNNIYQTFLEILILSALVLIPKVKEENFDLKIKDQHVKIRIVYT